MKLDIRPPRDNEWSLCRRLLPETFDDGTASRDYLLCLREQAPRVVAAAAFRRHGDALSDLRLHVVPSLRRSGVGSRIVEHLGQEGAATIEAIVDLVASTGVEAFAARNGFAYVERLTWVEGDLADMRRRIGRLRIPVPAAARCVPLASAPVAQIAELHARHVVEGGPLNPWRFLIDSTPHMELSFVMMIDERIVGMLLGDHDGKTVTVRSRVVIPEYRGTGVNAQLLRVGLDRAWAAGASRIRFSYADSNRDTVRLAGRFRTSVARVDARFVRKTSTTIDVLPSCFAATGANIADNSSAHAGRTALEQA